MARSGTHTDNGREECGTNLLVTDGAVHRDLHPGGGVNDGNLLLLQGQAAGSP